MASSQQARKSFRWNTLAALITAALQFFQLILVAGFSTPAQMGLYATFVIVLTLCRGVIEFGLVQSLIQKQRLELSECTSVFWLVQGVVLSLCALLLLGSYGVAQFSPEAHFSQIIGPVVLIFVMTGIGQPFYALLQRNLEFDKVAKVDIAAIVVASLSIPVFLWQGLNAWSLVYGTMILFGLRTLLSVRYAWPSWRPGFAFAWSDLKGHIRFALYKGADNTLSYAGARLDQMFIGIFLGAEKLGLYSLGWQLLVDPVYKINPMMTKVAMPLFSRLQRHRTFLRRNYLRLIQAIFTLNVPIIAIMLLLASQLIPHYYGEDWAVLQQYLPWFALVALVRALCNPSGTLVSATGHVHRLLSWNLISLSVGVPLLWTLSQQGSLQTMLYGVAGYHAFIALGVYLWLIRPVLGRCARAYSHSALLPLSVGGLALGLSLAALPWLLSVTPLLVATGLAVSGFILLYGLGLRTLTPQLIHNITSSLKR